MTPYNSEYCFIFSLRYDSWLNVRYIIIIRSIRNNRENISKFIYNTYNLPETIFQKVKVSFKKNKFKLNENSPTLGISFLKSHEYLID